MPQQFNQGYYNPYMPAMDNLSQLRAQQYNFQTQMSGTYQQPVTLPAQSAQQSNQTLLYVQGEAAAKSWMLAPGQSILLMDSESPTFYIKSADNSGMPYPLRIFDYKERVQSVPQNIPQNAPQDPQQTQNNLDDKYVTRQEYDGLQGKYNDLQGKYMEILNRLDNFPVLPMVSEDGKKPATAANKTRNRGGNSNE